MPEEMTSTSTDEFGMTEEEMKNYKMQGIISRIKFYLAAIAPTVVKILSAIIYYLIRFIKSFVSASFRMLLGKEV